MPSLSTFEQGAFKKLFGNAPDALILINRNGEINEINQRVEELFGFDRSQLIGQPVELLIPIRYRSDHVLQRERFFERPADGPMGLWRTLTGQHRSGKEIPIEVNLSFTKLGDDDFVLASVRDVSIRRYLEQQMRGDNATLQQIAIGNALNSVLDSICNCLESCNSSFRTLIARYLPQANRLKVLAAPKCSENAQEIMDRIDERHQQWHQALRNAEPLYLVSGIDDELLASFSGICLNFGVRACWLEPVTNALDKPLGSIVVLCDEPREPTTLEKEILRREVSLVRIGIERDERYQELLEHQTQLRQKQKLEALGALAGGIGHEFNNLLQIIASYNEFAIEEATQANRNAYDLEMVRSATQRATLLTRQLLTFCRKNPLEIVSIDVKDLVAETLSLLKPLFPENIDLSLVIHAGLPRIQGDYNQMQQVLINLCINARDAMPNGGQLQVRAFVSKWGDEAQGEERHDHLFLVVADTGEGMTSEIQERIFEPFFTTGTSGKGTGLGLSTALGIVQQHRGQIEVESKIGIGSTFSIILPLPSATNSDKMPRLDQVQLNRNRKENGWLLVSEDDSGVQAVLERILLHAGYQVKVVSSGEQALTLFLENPDSFLMAILDVRTAGLDGRTIGKKIREVRPNFPVILCTGYDPGIEQQEFGQPKFITLIKPVESSRLIETVKNCLGEECSHKKNIE